MKRNMDTHAQNVSAGKGINWEDYFSTESKITLESAYISIPKPY